MRSTVILAMKTRLIFIFIFWSSLLLADNPVSLSFQEIKNHFDSSAYDHQRVAVRGFYYQTESGEQLLAEQPNLKSCCVGSKKKEKEQIRLIGEISPPSKARAITVEGDFSFNRDSKQITLNNSIILADAHSSPSSFLCAAIAIFLFLTTAVLIKKLRK